VRLKAKYNKYSSSVDFLEKVPYCCLFLSYACFKGGDYAQAEKWANFAIDGFDQINHNWNRAIARWLCGLYYKKGGDSDDAESFFKAAAKLITQEILDNKRKSLYKKAKDCEIVYQRLLEEVQLLREIEGIRALPDKLGNNEAELFQRLLLMVLGDSATAERLMQS
jgi:tetratricopeptide (TPR) repeat protein